jgi:hypothetical protein
VKKCGKVLALRADWLRDWNCGKKTEQSVDNIMEGQKEENAIITMVSDPAIILFGFILIMATMKGRNM